MMNILTRIKCFIFGHNFKKIRNLSAQTDLFCCSQCKRKYAFNYSVRCALEYDREVKKFYKELNKAMKDKK